MDAHFQLESKYFHNVPANLQHWSSARCHSYDWARSTASLWLWYTKWLYHQAYADIWTWWENTGNDSHSNFQCSQTNHLHRNITDSWKKIFRGSDVTGSFLLAATVEYSEMGKHSDFWICDWIQRKMALWKHVVIWRETEWPPFFPCSQEMFHPCTVFLLFCCNPELQTSVNVQEWKQPYKLHIVLPLPYSSSAWGLCIFRAVVQPNSSVLNQDASKQPYWSSCIQCTAFLCSAEKRSLFKLCSVKSVFPTGICRCRLSGFGFPPRES